MPTLRRSNRPSNKVDCDVYSIVTETNSTSSNLPGPGRTLGRLLSVGGARVETAIGIAGEMIGLGPVQLVIRMLFRIDGQWVKCRVCTWHHQHARSLLSFLVRPRFEDMIDYLLHFNCVRCRGRHLEAILSNELVRRDCIKLIGIVRDSNAETSIVAVLCFTALVYLHPELAALFVSLGLQSALEEGLSDAHDIWSEVLKDAHACCSNWSAGTLIQEGEEQESSLVTSDGLLSPEYWTQHYQNWSFLFHGLKDKDKLPVYAFRLCLIMQEPPALFYPTQTGQIPKNLMKILWSQLSETTSPLRRHILIATICKSYKSVRNALSSLRTRAFGDDLDFQLDIWSHLWEPMVFNRRKYPEVYALLPQKQLRAVSSSYTSELSTGQPFQKAALLYISEYILEVHADFTRTLSHLVDEDLRRILGQLYDCVWSKHSFISLNSAVTCFHAAVMPPQVHLADIYPQNISADHREYRYEDRILTLKLCNLALSAANCLLTSHLRSFSTLTQMLLIVINRNLLKVTKSYLAVMEKPNDVLSTHSEFFLFHSSMSVLHARSQLSYAIRHTRKGKSASSSHDEDKGTETFYTRDDLETWNVLLWGIRTTQLDAVRIQKTQHMDRAYVARAAHITFYKPEDQSEAPNRSLAILDAMHNCLKQLLLAFQHRLLESSSHSRTELDSGRVRLTIPDSVKEWLEQQLSDCTSTCLQCEPSDDRLVMLDQSSSAQSRNELRTFEFLDCHLDHEALRKCD